MAKTLEYNATLVERIDISETLALFRVKPDETPEAGENDRWFIPGQYMVIGLNNEEKPELGGVRRPMSIASPPQDTEVIDFYIKFVSHPESDNPLTHLLWKTKAGDRMYARVHATGKFTVHHAIGDDDPRMRVLVGAGTGMAPFICMVDDELRHNPAARLERWGMMHGVSYPVELGYRDRLERMAAEHGMPYLPTVSRPQHSPDWKGPTGRVEDFFRSDRLADTEKRLALGEGELNPEHATIFICGLNGTIKETIERLLPRGFVPDHRKIRRALEIPEEVRPSLFFEQYDNTPIIDVKDPAEVERIKALYRPVG
jgi:ferredoxin--NADP+ reductase